MQRVYVFGGSAYCPVDGIMNVCDDAPESASVVTIAEYVWISEPRDCVMRSKTRVLFADVAGVSEVPAWNYDGSSTGQATTEASEVLLQPVAVYDNPLPLASPAADDGRPAGRRAKVRSILVLCECGAASGAADLRSNTRAKARLVFSRPLVDKHKPWYGLEQEYVVLAADGRTPIAWHVGERDGCVPQRQEMHYCGTKDVTHIGRQLAETHLHLCLRAGIRVSGLNAEVLPGQWEFQVGPCAGIDAADQLWVARYLLLRAAESMHLAVTFAPKPAGADWNGSGCHANYSTELMRAECEDRAGLGEIHRVVARLSEDHARLMASACHEYGRGNELRLTGKHETSNMTTFTCGVGDRTASVRIPNETHEQGAGYLEDRRPAANADPYMVTAYLFAASVTE